MHGPRHGVMPPLPTLSPELLPISEFALLTTPLTPLLPLPHVTAPAVPFQLELLTT